MAIDKPRCTWKMHSKLSIVSWVKKELWRNYYPLQGSKKRLYKKFKMSEMPQEFQDIYRDLKKESHQISRIFSQDKHPVNILKVFENLLPNSFFGPLKHRRVFVSIIKLIITRSVHECIFVTDLYEGYNLDEVPWLENVNHDKREKIFKLGIKIVLDKIVLWLFRKLYYPAPIGESYEIQFFPRVMWNRFMLKVRNILVANKWFIPVEYSVDMVKKVRGMLSIKKKSSLEKCDEFRPYVRIDIQTSLHKNEILNKKQINKHIYDYAKKLCHTKIDNFYKYWKNYTKQTKGYKLYCAKIDLLDCFGNINVELLMRIIKEAENIPTDIKNYLNYRIQNQYVRFGREKINGKKTPKIWKWEHGLLQGDRFSAPLCELYMSYLDREHLKDFNKRRCFLHRKVDDYFFCSTVESDVINFIEVITKYVKLNESKTQTNAGESDDHLIEYCGLLINLNNREITRNFKFKKGTQLHRRFKIWNPSSMVDTQSLLAKSVYFPYNNFNFTAVTLNLDYNSLHTALHNFFEGMVYVAFKFDCTVMATSRRKPNITNKVELENFISHTVWHYSSIARDHLGENAIKINVLIKIAYYGFIVVLRRRKNRVYRQIIIDINEIQRINFTPNFNMTSFKKLPLPFLNISMKRIFAPSS